MRPDHRARAVTEAPASSLLSSAVLTFAPALVPFVFQAAAAAPGITSRCRDDRGGKRLALPVSASAKGGNPSSKPPRDLPSGLISRFWFSDDCLFRNRRLAGGVETPLWAH